MKTLSARIGPNTVAYKQLRPKIILEIENEQIRKLWSQKNETRTN